MLAQQVSVNYNHNANFLQYHTYAWGSNSRNAIQNSILAQVAQQDIENAMLQNGLQKVDESQTPDLILTASDGEHESTEMLFRNQPINLARPRREHAEQQR